jgi:hypothetical protein
MTDRFVPLEKFLIVCLGVIVATSLAAQPAINGLESLPPDRRASLIQSIDRVVESYRSEEWGNVYANLTQLPPLQESVEQFRKRVVGGYPRNVGRALVKFVPESIVQQPANQWAVWGCATLQGKGERQIRERWILIASWERDRWFFSELLPASPLDARKPLPCRPKQTKR